LAWAKGIAEAEAVRVPRLARHPGGINPETKSYWASGAYPQHGIAEVVGHEQGAGFVDGEAPQMGAEGRKKLQRQCQRNPWQRC